MSSPEKSHPHHPSLSSPGNSPLRLVFWETTAGCNLECIHCRRLDVTHELMKNDLSTQQAFFLVDSILEAGNPILILSGGEPLYRPDIIDIASYAVKHGLNVALATNGTLIDSLMAQQIVNSGIRRVSISIDGADVSTHDHFRQQQGSLAQALEGYHQLKALGMSMQINCTLTKHNAHQKEAIYQMALDLGADALHFFMLVPVGCGVQIAETNMLSASEYEEILNWIYERSLENKIQLKPTCAPHYLRIKKQKEAQKGISSSSPTQGMHSLTKGCLAGTSVCFISHTGEVFPCGYLPVTSGNILKASFKDIWNNSNIFNQLRDSSLLEGKCGVCEFNRVCMGCRARAYYATGNFMSDEPYCEYKPQKLR